MSGLVTTDPTFAGSDHSPDFEGWLIGLNIDPELSRCLETPSDDWVSVTCVMSPGDGFFFSQVSAGFPLTSQLTMRVLSDGTLQGISMPPNSVVVAIEREMRDWLGRTTPNWKADVRSQRGVDDR